MPSPTPGTRKGLPVPQTGVHYIFGALRNYARKDIFYVHSSHRLRF